MTDWSSRTPSDRSRSRSVVWVAAVLIGLLLIATGAGPVEAGNGNGSAGGGTGNDDIFSGVHIGQGGHPGNWGGASCTWTPGVLGPLHVPVATPGGTPVTVPEADGSTEALYLRHCAGQTDQWVWILQATAAQLAKLAADAIRKDLPKPDAVFSPPAGREVVHFPVWFAVPVGQWVPVSVTADVPGLAATVTATPTMLTFDPGDGGGGVSCAGPGPQWRPGMAEPATPPACSYTYSNASSAAPGGVGWSGQVSIRWRIAWTATNGQGGALDALSTTSTYELAVGEREGVEETN